MSSPVRKAIIPVAGLGTRFLPATKAQPKEMITLVDKPVIQYIVEEAVAAGIEEIIFVTSIGKRAIEDHFDRNFELEYRLKQKGKKKELDEVSRIGKLAKFAFVRQSKPMGDGHAILSALPFVDEHEPVAVLFGDAVTDSRVPAIKQLIAAYERYGDPVVGVTRVPKKDIAGYGVIDGARVGPRTYEIRRFVEKPSPTEAPSNMAVMGEYVLTPEIFQILKRQRPGKNGEIRIADALIAALKKGKPLYGVDVEGVWYDCGNKLRFLVASVAFGLKHPEVNGEFKKYLKKMLAR
ncbi:UTP--glucose-1-phosphate uridylyltransferase GalU [Patescibacteria group bacterium]|nr:MAG: UTP--glucose-1-phosphate uridylyltransferase GalU [Patescibacteria group bacterium]